MTRIERQFRESLLITEDPVPNEPGRTFFHGLGTHQLKLDGCAVRQKDPGSWRAKGWMLRSDSRNCFSNSRHSRPRLFGNGERSRSKSKSLVAALLGMTGRS